MPRIFQYQAQASPLSELPEATSPDRWQPTRPDLLPRPGALPAALVAGALFFVGPVVAAPALTPTPALVAPDFLRAPLAAPQLQRATTLTFAPAPVVVPGWDLSVYPDLLPPPQARAHFQPASLLGRATPYAEATTADRWRPTYPDWIRAPLPRPHMEQPPSLLRVAVPALTLGWGFTGPDLLRQPQARPSDGAPFLPRVAVAPALTLGAAFFGPDAARAAVGRAHLEAPSLFRGAAPFPESVTADRWRPVYPDWLRAAVGRPHLEPLPTIPRLPAPALTLGAAFYGPDATRAAIGRAHLEPVGLLGRAAPYAERVTADRWRPTFPDWLRVPVGRPQAEPSPLALLVRPPAPVIGTARYPDWLRAPAARAFLEPQPLLGRAAPFPERVTADRWKPTFPDFLRAPRRHPSAEPASVLGRAAPYPEAVSIDKWQPTRPDWLRAPFVSPQLEPFSASSPFIVLRGPSVFLGGRAEADRLTGEPQAALLTGETEAERV
jgi:hypothetical protein